MDWWFDCLTGMGEEYEKVIEPYLDTHPIDQRDIAEHLWILMENALFQADLDWGLKGLRGNPYAFIDDLDG